MNANSESILDSGTRCVDASRHPGFMRLFARDQLTIGLIMPLETYPDGPGPTMRHHLDMAIAADEAGFGALWMRDIPFFDPNYGDLGQVFEPLVYIAALATVTRSITIGTAGIVLPLREPKLLAKQVTSLDHLSAGRMLLGLSSGDRPSEYPLFDVDFDTRGERFRDAFQVYRTVAEQNFPTFESSSFGRSLGGLDMLPKPLFGHVPVLGIGRAQQSPQWVASNMDGMIGSTPPLDKIPDRVADWRRTVDEVGLGDTFRPFGIAGYLDLTKDRDHPFERLASGIRSGSRSLARFLESARSAGVNHAALNPKITRRPYSEILADLQEDVLPLFPSIGCQASSPARANDTLSPTQNQRPAASTAA
ncbi:luciferase-type oxidoreductase, BA3436 family [Sphingobium sp. AP50]|nr:luciferase-type oxidoreductase, BA3436 family [Sphingobium sp. AP50]